MLGFDAGVWLLGSIQFLGFSSAVAARLSERSRHQIFCQWLFLASLLLVGGATMITFEQGPTPFLISAATLSIMVLMAVVDFSRSRRPVVI